MTDEIWMRLALGLARRGDNSVSPNPMVGAVLVRRGKQIGKGWHRRFGEAHAEAAAIDSVTGSAEGAVLYVTLEPCNHAGKTSPCVKRILEAGIRRVVFAARDPNPGVRGGGQRALRRGGLDVVEGVLRVEADRLNESYLKHVTSGLPFIRLKAAQSLDGRIATSDGESKWISGVAARKWAHRTRRWADAILVGVGTIRADDPRLTVRDGRKAKAISRVVLDTHLRTPPDGRLLSESDGGPVLIYAAPVRGDSPRRRGLEGAGAEVVSVDRNAHGRVSLKPVLEDLARRGVGRLLVEGGGQVHASFLDEGLVDRVSLVIAPMVLGDGGKGSVAASRHQLLATVPRFDFESVRRIGQDVVMELRPRGE